MSRAVPKGWEKYQSMGKSVLGTKFIAFKVPLKTEICQNNIPEKDWFTPAVLLQKQPQLKTIIDLTDTSRYYDPQEFESNGVAHVKINITGGGRLPPSFKIRQFYEAVDEFTKKFSDDPDALIGVHCTHGLNRTGYFICKYMVDRLKVSPEDAISRFEIARGHTMERENYVNGIRNDKQLSNAPYQKNPRPRNQEAYSSPLDNSYGEESDRSSYNRRPGGSRYQQQQRYNSRGENWMTRNHEEGRSHTRNPRSSGYSGRNRDENRSSNYKNWGDRP